MEDQDNSRKFITNRKDTGLTEEEANQRIEEQERRRDNLTDADRTRLLKAVADLVQEFGFVAVIRTYKFIVGDSATALAEHAAQRFPFLEDPAGSTPVEKREEVANVMKALDKFTRAICLLDILQENVDHFGIIVTTGKPTDPSEQLREQADKLPVHEVMKLQGEVQA